MVVTRCWSAALLLFVAAVGCSSPPSGGGTGKASVVDAGHPIVFVKDTGSGGDSGIPDSALDGGAKDTGDWGGCDFAPDPAPGQPGSTCATSSDCDSGYCVESASGRICTEMCTNCCPTGFLCKQVSATDPTAVCMPRLMALCRPCLTDAECGAIDEGALCVPHGSDGSFCGGACSIDVDCASGYACKAVQGQKGAGKQCVRTSGECGCSPKATSDGALTSCAKTSSAGTCPGVRKCGLEGLSACDAPVPATETCNGVDDDCNGVTDGPNSAGCTPFFQDSDGDGFGVGVGQCLCAPAGLATATKGGDCNDNQAAIHPGGEEICNGLDDNCDGQTDEGVGGTFYPDADQDGFGGATGAKVACKAPPGYVAKGGDCDDFKPGVNPDGVEVCNGLDDNCDGQTDEGVQKTFFADADGDGYGKFDTAKLACSATPGFVSNGTDCDDTKASVHPGATEVCNSVDDDCNGQTDEGFVGKTWYADQDGDGYGNGAVTELGCSAPAGFVAASTDCDDTKASVHPGAAEACNGVDDNCDGATDEGVKSTYFLDGDADGYGTAKATTLACSVPAGYSVNDSDCDDLKPTVHPGAAEICNGIDDDCNGATDDGVPTQAWYQDADGDGFGNAAASILGCQQPGGYVAKGSDCNDANAAVFPGAAEVCNGIDDDCNGQTDEGLLTVFYQDSDGDGFGNPAATTLACAVPAGYSANKLDCDDANASVHPGGTEVCNGLDDDCNGLTDDGFAGSTWYQDADSDGYGNAAATVSACVAPAGYIASSGDCDDTKSAVHPGATELCNGIDDDCNGLTDDNAGGVWYVDADGDGYGSAASTVVACGKPDGYVSNKGDCDDANAAVHPGAAEVCNGIDDNCEGRIDEGVKATFYQDADGDSYGNLLKPLVACTNPGGYVATGTDCDDTNAAIHPGVAEVCNSKDDNCNGQTDEGLGATTYYQDADGDGYGNPSVALTACTQPSGYVTNNTDCNDNNKTVNPGGFLFQGSFYESINGCNGIDNDCNGYTDDGSAWPYYKDNDGDGYGAASSGSLSVCIGKVPPSGYSRDGDDCDDSNGARHPNAIEVFCNGIDDDCVGGDYCGATCSAATLFDFSNGPQGWSVGGGWTWDFYYDPGFPPFIGPSTTRQLAYENDKQTGYAAAPGGATTTTLINIPNAAKFIQVSVLFKNSTYEDSNNVKTPDPAATVVVTLNGTASASVGPYSSYDDATHKVKLAVDPAWWKTQVPMTISVTTPNSSTDSWSGYFIDDIQIVCN